MIPPMSFHGVKKNARWAQNSRIVLSIMGSDREIPRSTVGSVLYLPFIEAATIPYPWRTRWYYEMPPLDEVTAALGLNSHYSAYPRWLKDILCVGLWPVVDEGGLLFVCTNALGLNPWPVPDWAQRHYQENFT